MAPQIGFLNAEPRPLALQPCTSALSGPAQRVAKGRPQTKRMDTDIPVAYAQALPVPASTTAVHVAGTAFGGILPPAAPPLNHEQIAQLRDQGFTAGLAQALDKNNAAFPLRYWIVDNSGSMVAQDVSWF